MIPHRDDCASLRPHDPALHTGLPTVDRQHQALIAEFNLLIADPGAVPNSEAFSDILTRLGRQLGAHFVYEESLFKGLGLSVDESARHHAAHEEILSQYVALNLDLMHDRPRQRDEVLAMVCGWVTTHVVAHDLDLRDRVAN